MSIAPMTSDPRQFAGQSRDDNRRTQPGGPSTESRDRPWGSLTAHPFSLTLVLLAVRLIAFPYAGLIHDAQLYGIQSLNRAQGFAYQNDLFFANGSQDNYSLFSMLVAPMVSFLGLSTAFYLAHLIASGLFIAAQVLLVRRLIDNRTTAFTALLVMTVCDLPYGGWNIFVVHEPFLTARLPACALCLFALERMLADRPVAAWGLAFAAMAIHPLMSVPTIGVILLGQLITGKPAHLRRWLPPTAIGMAALLTIGVYFGVVTIMDDQWLMIIEGISPQCFPSDWTPKDWADVGIAVLAVSLSLYWLQRRDRWLPIATLIVGITGLLASLFAQVCPLAILIQGQPFRSLWLLELMAVPLAIGDAAWLWRAGQRWHRILSIMLAAWCLRLLQPIIFADPGFWKIAILCVLGAMLTLRFIEPDPLRRRTMRWNAVAAGLGVAALVLSTATFIDEFALMESLRKIADPIVIYSYAARMRGGAISVAVGFIVMAMLIGRKANTLGVAFRSLTLILAISVANIWLFHSPVLLTDTEQVTDLRNSVETSTGKRLPTVYWPTDVRNVWFGLPACSFVHFAQVQGALFDRATAIEADRRLDMVRPFEMQRIHSLGSASNWERLGRVFGPNARSAPANAADVRRLASEPALDFIVLDYPVAGAEAKQIGDVWIYDCARLRGTKDGIAPVNNIRLSNAGTQALPSRSAGHPENREY